MCSGLAAVHLANNESARANLNERDDFRVVVFRRMECWRMARLWLCRLMKRSNRFKGNRSSPDDLRSELMTGQRSITLWKLPAPIVRIVMA